jgi:hypothetical protein
MPDTKKPEGDFPWKLVRQRSCYRLSAIDVPAHILVTSKVATLERELRRWLWIDDGQDPSGLEDRISTLMNFLEEPPVIEVFHCGRRAKEVPVDRFIRCALAGKKSVPLALVDEDALENGESCEIDLDVPALEKRLGALPDPVLQHGEICLVEPQDAVSKAQITEWLVAADDPEQMQALLQEPVDLLVYGSTEDYGGQGGNREVDPGSPED